MGQIGLPHPKIESLDVAPVPVPYTGIVHTVVQLDHTCTGTVHIVVQLDHMNSGGFASIRDDEEHDEEEEEGPHDRLDSWDALAEMVWSS